MSGEDAYESLPDSASLGVVLMAGAAAGIGEHCIMFPVDCVKTRMQALACESKSKLKYSSVGRNIFHIMKTEGFFRPIQGVTPMAAGAGPAHAVYFACYEQIKKWMIPKSKSSVLPESAVHAVAGASATVFHDAVMTPAEVVKQRMQMCCSPYKSALSCASSVYKAEGLAAFYRSYTTMLTMNIPFQATQFMVYEKMMGLLNPEREYVPWKHAVAGAVAGAIAASVTMPWDVCKTLLNTQEANVLNKLNTKRVVGMKEAARTVRSLAGYAGFFQGLRPRILYQMPATAISWSVYEIAKFYLNESKESSKSSNIMEDTIEDLKLANQRRGNQLASKTTPDEADKKDTRLWDSIVTDMPRPLRAETDLVVRDRTFPVPGYRT